MSIDVPRFPIDIFMVDNTIYILSVTASFLLSLCCGFFFIPAILNFCRTHKLYDLPNARKVHRHAIPRLGGIAFLPSMLLAFMFCILALHYMEGTTPLRVSLWTYSVMVGTVIVYAIGVVDDMIGLNAKMKFPVQILAAALLPLSGLYLNDLYGLAGIHQLSPMAGSLLTIFVIVLIVNAFNLIDGIDGLAACLTLIALSGYLFCFIREELWIYCIMISGLMGVLVAYLYFNLFLSERHKKKIFMGDSGSLTLGYVLAFLFVKFSMNNADVPPFYNENRMLTYSLLVVPCFDVIRVFLVRLRNGRPLFHADKNHVQHKIMRTGMTQHQTLILIIFMQLGFIALNMTTYLATSCNITIMAIVDIFVYIAIHLLIDRYIKLNGRKPFE